MPVLDGYRVLDLSIAMSGPLAAMRLGDLGADVIKIEPPAGEWQRHPPGRRGRRAPGQRVVPGPEPEQAQPGRGPQGRPRPRAAARAGRRGRRVPAELPPRVDRDWGGYYSSTRRSLAAAWIRPRDDGWIGLQERAGVLVREAVTEAADAAVVVAAINDDYRVLKGGAQ